jgi:hypothetical protein
MVRRGQNALGPERAGRLHDSLVVGRDHHPLRQFRPADLLPRVLDEVFARILGENFRGEPSGRVASRNTDYYLHGALHPNANHPDRRSVTQLCSERTFPLWRHAPTHTATMIRPRPGRVNSPDGIPFPQTTQSGALVEPRDLAFLRLADVAPPQIASCRARKSVR